MDQAITTPMPASLSAREAGAGTQAPAATLPRPRSTFLPAVATLWQREMVRFFRQRSRVVGALATPVLFWLLLGSGLNRTFVVPGADPEAAGGYLAYLFPGTLVMILLFTAIFSTFTVIDDRKEGFLQAVLVAPVARLAIILGKTLGGASIATLQSVVFLALYPLIAPVDPVRLALLVPVMFVLAAALTALGLCLAWVCESTTGFHAIMNLVLFPMWFLCGAVFPVATAPLWLRVPMYLNPLTYGQTLVAGLLRPEHAAAQAVSLPAAAGITALFLLAAVAAAAWVATHARRAVV